MNNSFRLLQITRKLIRSFVDLPGLMIKPASMTILFVGLTSLCGAHSAFAQIPSWGIDDFQAPVDTRWRSITIQDVRAAYQLLKDNHPGGALELHDVAFQQRLNSGLAVALKRAQTVTSYQGYAATLAGFAKDMGDKHIWSRPTFAVNVPRWPGFIVSKRGNVWIVSDTDPPQSTLLGASLISCDGADAEDLARTNLGAFRADWSIGAQRIQSAPWLLVDEGNPFIARPKACTFEHNGLHQTVTLDWTRIKHENLEPRLKKAIGAGAAGYGVRRVGDGYWIALESLMDPRADDVVNAVENEKAALRNASFVVLDLRGNHGGSDLLGRQIAVSLFGSDAVDARIGPEAEVSCGSPDGAWRASEGNINDLKFHQHMAMAGGSELKQLLDGLLRDSLAARAQGKTFTGPITCPSAPSKPTTTLPPGLMKGRLILLTDNGCFSACLSVTEAFRKLGAFHVGQTTDAATRYTAVREQYLPSGYSLFSTLQAVDPSGPHQEGPFEPQMSYNGDVGDTAALESWVVGTVVPASRR